MCVLDWVGGGDYADLQFVVSLMVRACCSIAGRNKRCVISGIRREVDEMCAPMGYYSAYSGNSLPTLRDNVSIPSSRAYRELVPERR
jgi:hypothetical protein